MKTILTISVNGGVTIPFASKDRAIFCLREQGFTRDDAREIIYNIENAKERVATSRSGSIVKVTCTRNG